MIKEGSKEAQINQTYGKDKHGRTDLNLTGFVLINSKDMISIIYKTDGDKVDNYVIYPQYGVGFLISYKAGIFGDSYTKTLSTSNVQIPFGSANIIRMIKLE